MENSIKIPRSLHKVHGEQATLWELVLVHSLSVVASVFLLVISPGANFDLVKSILLFLLTYDLIGGVVANFSEGTSRYYAESAQRRFKFLILHLLQPAVMCYLFKDQVHLVLIVSSYVIVSAIIVNYLKSIRHQLTISGTLVVLGLFILQFYGANASLTVQFLLAAFLIKLPLAWAVRWYSIMRK